MSKKMEKLCSTAQQATITIINNKRNYLSKITVISKINAREQKKNIS